MTHSFDPTADPAADAGASTGPVEAQLHEDLRDALKNPVDDARRPNVLLIGDSISIGYTLPVRFLLRGQANVFRPPVNCQHTAFGLQQLDQWLGDRRWAVIHFNWGIWDTHYLDVTTGELVRDERAVPRERLKIRHDLKTYRRHLEALVTRLQATGAQLIWAHTTPVLFRTGDRFEDIRRYNAVAGEVMHAHRIPINDLYTASLAQAAEWQTADRCHFNERGNTALGALVAEAIRKLL